MGYKLQRPVELLSALLLNGRQQHRATLSASSLPESGLSAETGLPMPTQVNRQGHIHFLLILPMFLLITLYILTPSVRAVEGSSPGETPDSPHRQPVSETCEIQKASREIDPVEEPEESEWEDYGIIADNFHKMVSRKLMSSANWLDSFFRDKRSEIEENKTSLRVRLSNFWEEGEGVKTDVRARLRLVLPALKNKLHIMVSGERDEDSDFKNKPEYKRSELDENAERNVNLSLRYFTKMAKNRNVSFKVGARLNKFPPVFYAGPRFRASKQIDAWMIRFTQEVKYFSDDGWETGTDFDFERSLSERTLFRASTEGNWYEEDVGYYYDINFTLYQIVDENRALEYAWNNYFETRPCHQLAQTLLWIKYRQRFWRKWLFFELRPQVAFREEDDYEPTPGITFTVEALFGDKKW